MTNRTPIYSEKEMLNLEYLPRLTVPNAEYYIEAAAARSAQTRTQMTCHLEQPYGETALQRLDIFPAQSVNAPVLIFIHGGYWRALDKKHYSDVAEPFVAAGATVVIPNYNLCPEVTISDIVQQIQNALTWAYRNIQDYNGDPNQIFLSGHSAGGHLTGMMMATDWEVLGLPTDLLKGSAPLSGLFDIEPHRHTDLQNDIRLSAKEAAANSPLLLPLTAKCPVICAVGGGESASFHRQSKDFTKKCLAEGLPCDYLELGNDNHFDITDRLHRADDPLTLALLKLMKL